MAAPKGNEFWKVRSKHGRDVIFSSPEMLREQCFEYFQWCEDNPLSEHKVFPYQGKITQAHVPKMRALTIGGLCIFLGINKDTWYDYRKKEDFSDVCQIIEEIIKTQKFTGAAADLLNPSIIARDLGLKDHVAQDTIIAQGEVKDPVAEMQKRGIPIPDIGMDDIE